VSGPFGETVVHHTRAVTSQDSLGNDVYTDTDTTLTHVTLYPRESVELVQGQDTNVIGLTAVFKPAVTVVSADEFTARGVRWRVDGEPAQYHSSLTGATLTKLNLTRVTG
jgi:hypothetical protein